MRKNLISKVNKIKSFFSKKGSVVIAFSGGVDSASLAAIANDALKDKAIAVSIFSETSPKKDMIDASCVAKQIGINHIIKKHSELSNKNITENTSLRCYYCKKQIITSLRMVANEYNIDTICEGTNAGEKNEYRPGIRALKEENIYSPFLEFNINKNEIREIARAYGLSISDKPSSACLSSRIPYGNKITIEKINQIEASEDAVSSLLHAKQVRVRHHDNIARIEVDETTLSNMLNCDVKKLVKTLKKLGFTYVTLDLESYRAGSLNEDI